MDRVSKESANRARQKSGVDRSLSRIKAGTDLGDNSVGPRVLDTRSGSRAVPEDAVQDNAIKSRAIGSLTGAKGVARENVQVQAIGSDQLSSEVGDKAVAQKNVQNSAVGTDQLIDNAVTSAKIGANQVRAVELKTDGDALTERAVSNAAMRTNSADGRVIADGLKDPASTTAGLRTLGTAAGQAAAGPHTHAVYLTKAEADDLYSALSHLHDARYSQLGHVHDTRYFTQTQSDDRYLRVGGTYHGQLHSLLTTLFLAWMAVMTHAEYAALSWAFVVLAALSVLSAAFVRASGPKVHE